MRVVFMGTPTFAVPVLSALLESNYEVVGVISRPDRPIGRGQKMSPNPINRYAMDHNLRISQPVSLRSEEVQRQIFKLKPNVIIIAAYSRYIPNTILNIPDHGCLNIHPSLLPKYRGPSPVSTAILADDNTTGVTVMKVTDMMDAGPIIASREMAIEPDDTTENLTVRLFEMGAELLMETLPKWTACKITAEQQQPALVTTTKLLTRQDGKIDWTEPADLIARKVRAYHPWPGSYALWNGKLLKIITAHTNNSVELSVPPSTVISLSEGILAVATAQGILIIDALQLEGGKPTTASEFLSGHRDIIGAHLS
ncbi:methionyl-tRNA formyltransferase [Dehalococcoidia bacterium]|jgi:methionyl-tRNA formyltransferase|nr:methionyl-tRNA formyltransferase [Dehalococcoidia bacterium]